MRGFTLAPYTSGVFLMGEHLEQGDFYRLVNGAAPVSWVGLGLPGALRTNTAALDRSAVV